MLQILGEQPPALWVCVIKDPTCKPKHVVVFVMLLAAPPFPPRVSGAKKNKKKKEKEKERDSSETTLGTEQTPSRPSVVALTSIKAVSFQTTGSLFIE